MEYRVEELAAAAELRVDTLRFYQAQKLLPAPARRGRVAIYDDAHLACLRRIRDLKRDGFSLAQIRRVLDPPAADGGAPQSEPGHGAPLLEALVEESVGRRTFGRAELAAEAGIPEALVRAAESAGLIEALRIDGEDRFTEADAALARAGLAILAAGLPLKSLLELASEHVSSIEAVCDRAIDLFDDHVRKPAAGDDHAITAVFRALLPHVTRVVALHFQRTLVNRALARLEGREEAAALEAALSATDEARLEVEWR